MAEIKRYEEMKDSGIPGVNKIPSSWDCKRGKAILTILDRPVKETDEVITCFRDGEVTLRKNRRESGFTNSLKEIGYQGIEPGDLVVHGMDGFAGSIGISDSRGKSSPVLNVMDSSENKKYLMYYLRALAYRDVFMSLSTGIRVRSCDLRWNKIANLMFPIPTKLEQQAIANYLDTRCSLIDEIIEEAKKSIEEYKKLKAAVIQDAVTKGLDPDVEMKDSGVEWIGEIPKHWSFVRIPRILDYSNPYPLGDGDHGLISTEDYQNEGIPYIRVQNLGWGTALNLDNIVYISEENNERIKNSQLKPNDILFCKTGATIGKTGIVPKYLHISNTTSHVGKITVSPRYNAKYVFYVLSSNIGYRQFWEIACQKTTRPELAISETRQIRITLPQTKQEQDNIVKYLDGIIPEYDDLILKKQALIEDLQSYKKSLIYEIVTGKRKVI